MSAEAAGALWGTKVYIKGQHTFEVTNQQSVIAEGGAIMIFPPGQTQAEWSGKDTGKAGKPVKQGYKVFVNNASVVFQA